MSDLTLRAFLREDLTFEQKMVLGRELWNLLIPYLRDPGGRMASTIEWRSVEGHVDVQDVLMS